MATRFYFCASANPTNSLISPPAFDAAWNETDGAVVRWMVPSLTHPLADAIANGAALSSTASNWQLHRQYISPRMIDGLNFTTGTTFKCQILGLESAANDNIVNRSRCVKVISDDGGTVRATLITHGNAASLTEWNTSQRNLSFLAGETSGANYTTVLGDRLLLEIGHKDASGTSVSGTMRFGVTGGTGDAGENETETTGTLRPWFETSLDLTFCATLVPPRKDGLYLPSRNNDPWSINGWQ